MKAKIISSSPILLVKDVVNSSDWYRDKLGFECVKLYGEPPNFCIFQRDGFYLMFAKCDPDKIVPNWKLVDKTSNVYFWVDNVEELYKEFISNEATIDYELCIQPYELKNLVLMIRMAMILLLGSL